MTRAIAIIGAITSAWISGNGSGSPDPSKNNGAVIWLLVALGCGYWAWTF